MRLTKIVIDSAKPPVHGERYLRDDAVRGLGVRVTAGGIRTFVFETRIKGRVRRISLGRWGDLNIAQARDKAHGMRAAIARGEDPHAARLAERREMTFGDLVDRYMAEYSRIHKRPRSIADDEYYLAHYVPPTWRTRRLSDISRADVGRLHAGLSKDHGRYAGNHTVRLLRAMLNWARDRGVLRGDNPARIKLFAEKRRERFLTPEELIKVNAALLEEPDWRWRAYFPLTLMLGTRKSELLAARWADVDLAQRTLRLPETKAGRPHLLPLPQAAAEMLAALPSRGKSEHVFPGVGAAGHVMEPAKAWQRVRARAGVVDVRIHDLRHTLASWLVAAGYGLPLIGRALNHAQVATTERYAHLALDSVRTALEKNAALMFGTTQPAAADNSGEGSESSQNVAVDKIG